MNKQSRDYYAGGYRFVRGGVPCRVAAWVKDLSPVSRDDFLRGKDERRSIGVERRKQLALSVFHPQTRYMPFLGLAAFGEACRKADNLRAHISKTLERGFASAHPGM